MQFIIQSIKDILKGGVIGVANIIPGVSGGTMALVMGIYERLISAIHNISFSTIKTFFRLFTFKKEAVNDFTEEFKKIDAPFLMVLALGAMCAILPLSHVMKYLLNVQHDPTYGFFFGLVLISILVPLKLIKQKNITTILCAVLAIGIIYGSDVVSIEQKKEKVELARQTAQQNPDSATAAASPVKPLSVKRILFIMLLGAITISAMILPGISGSFLLLLLGGYYELIQAIADKNIPFVGVFAIGCILGIVVFSRLLNYLLNNWHDQTMGFLTGLVIGSLWVIWPFKHIETMPDGGTEFLNNIMPSTFSTNELITLGTFLLGVVIVLAMILIEKRKGTVE